MSHPYHHAEVSAKLFGGTPWDYLPLHSWFDESKEHFADFRHRALRHHSQGIFEAERLFGPVLREGTPTRIVAEQHVKEDCGGRIPTVADWLKTIVAEPWMHKPHQIIRSKDE